MILVLREGTVSVSEINRDWWPLDSHSGNMTWGRVKQRSSYCDLCHSSILRVPCQQVPQL